VIRAEAQRLSGPTVVGRINLPSADDRKKPVASSDVYDAKKKKRKRIRKDNEKVSVPAKDNKQPNSQQSSDNKPKFGQGNKDNRSKARRPIRQEVSEVDVQKQIKDTLARLTSKGKSKTSKYRREKRDIASHRIQEELEQTERDKNILKVTEFVSVNELASMMEVPVTAVISTCMNMGLFVSINQRLDAETMALVADEFNFKVEFISVEVQEAIKVEEDTFEDLVHRPPIVTVMGHVDHGKTKLLDYIRNANVIAGEAGGITQHIGAYAVQLEDGRKITFLDTPGHEAFTAMRARGAKITDVAVIVVAADDGVKPQTKEAINHVSAAGVPIVFAINKVDKPDANPEKIKEELANLNYLVEDWGGKYQSQEISAKSGLNIENLLEKVLLEAELLDLKANPNKRAFGTVVESSLDRGRGYIATILVQGGTLNTGDVILAGSYFGHIKAMYNERNQKIDSAGPSMPVLILGLDGAPQAGDTFNVLEDIKEAKDIASKREMLQREQGLRTKKHITLDEIGRRIAIGNFQELNIIVKGDVDGSVEALSDSLIKLSTPEIQVNVIHKAVGQISESDVVLATASNAIIVGFQVRPSVNARKLAEKEQIDIRFYSIIYDAIEEIRAAMEGMLSPEIKEEITGTAEIREAFKITKVGTVAGCFVKEGKLLRSSKVRIIRDGIVIYTGELGTLKRFKEDVKEVSNGYECGLNIHNFNDIKVGDFVEGFTEFEVKKKL
jgi:translation initiation factor IF-2